MYLNISNFINILVRGWKDIHFNGIYVLIIELYSCEPVQNQELDWEPFKWSIQTVTNKVKYLTGKVLCCNSALHTVFYCSPSEKYLLMWEKLYYSGNIYGLVWISSEDTRNLWTMNHELNWIQTALNWFYLIV